MRVCQSDLPAAVAAPRSAGRLKLEDRFVKLFDELWQPVYKYLFRVGLRSEEAEDIAQEAFLRLFKHLLEQRREENLQGWIFRVAHNLAVDQYKRQRLFTLKSPQEWTELSGLLPDQTPNPEERLLDEERIARIDQRLAMLTSRQAQCLDLRMEGLRYREIGDLLGVTVSTVVQSLDLATRKLRNSKLARAAPGSAHALKGKARKYF